MAFPTYQSIHGSRFGITAAGLLRVDGNDLIGEIPTLGKDFFVDSVTGADTSDGRSTDRALATWIFAFDLCRGRRAYLSQPVRARSPRVYRRGRDDGLTDGQGGPADHPVHVGFYTFGPASNAASEGGEVWH